jgi:hypothetical protein
MEPPQRGSPSPATQVLAASLAMGLPQEDLEWLWRALKERAEQRSSAASARRPVPMGQAPREGMAYSGVLYSWPPAEPRRALGD